ncbi:hypothetical protein GGS26DRAFT_587590 [Hypomontagnella submonticulosa]|nr:hypothetical protein GGS26DRAFT_587590 [Hypomontagnella submonticulosa]
MPPKENQQLPQPPHMGPTVPSYPLPEGATAYQDEQSQNPTPLYNMPQELFDIMVNNLVRPEDLFNLSIASKRLYEALHSVDRLAFLDAHRFAERIQTRGTRDPPHIWRMYLNRHPNGPILSWIIRNNMPMEQILKLTEINETVCREALVGDLRLGIRPLVLHAIDCGRLDLTQEIAKTLHEKWTGHPFRLELAEDWVKHCVARSKDINIVRWLASEGTPLYLNDLLMLEGRGVIERFGQDWNELEQYIPREQVIQRPEGSGGQGSAGGSGGSGGLVTPTPSAANER